MSYLPIGKDTGNHNVVGNPDMELREQDRWLPIANVARLMKNTLPGTAKVSKDAKECMQECVSEFISFITSEASDKCVREKRKTINGEDILYSMHDLGFENYAEVLKIYLAKYREQQALKQERGESRSAKKPKKRPDKPAHHDLPGHPDLADLYMKNELVDSRHGLDDGPGAETEQSLDLLGYLATPSVKDVRSPDYFQPYDGAGSAASGPMHMDGVHVALDDKEPYAYNHYIHDDKDKNAPMDEMGKMEGEADMGNLAAGMANGASTYY